MIQWLELFEEAANEIQKNVKPIFGSEKALETMGRGAGGDMTKYVDQLAEDIVVRILATKNVSCTLISEECGEQKIGEGGSDYVILDSIDGTTNATKGIPFISTSIAHAASAVLKDVDVAFIKDLSLDTNFTAKKGLGAFQDHKRLRVSTIDNLGNAIIAVDLSCQEKLPAVMNQMLPILCRTLKIRILGSTALEVCYVASGALDIFLDFRGITRATDLAAAYLILREAGGIIVAPSGEELNILLKADSRTAFLAAANKPLCDEVFHALTEERT